MAMIGGGRKGEPGLLVRALRPAPVEAGAKRRATYYAYVILNTDTDPPTLVDWEDTRRAARTRRDEIMETGHSYYKVRRAKIVVY